MKRKALTLFILFCLILSFLPSAVANAETLPELEAPLNLTVELKQYNDGRPYFLLKWENPASILDGITYWDNHGEAPYLYQIDMKAGNGTWLSDAGGSLSGNSLHTGDDSIGETQAAVDPVSAGYAEVVDIKKNTYKFRVRYSYDYSDDNGDYYKDGPFSNIVSIGVDDFYQNASSWAKPELQAANDAELIPDILIGADMTKPITREEFCELALKLYEKTTGKTAQPVSPNPFKDTTNPQILKAFALGITKGTGDGTTFTPGKTITRQECATMLFRTIKAINPDGDYSIAGVPDFPDQKNIDSWAVEATKYMSKMGIIKGDTQGNFMPKATTTAQEASGYGTATREAAILMTVRTYKITPAD